ncbi:MAG: hypothetical protein ABR567_14990 [Myxococcales bacterium]|nr:hypothetical protein [Myxococcales bacterium]
MKVTGTIEFRDLEGGVWQLKGDDGKRYTLLGRISEKSGSRVEVEGLLDESGFGIAMAGPQLKVTKLKKI